MIQYTVSVMILFQVITCYFDIIKVAKTITDNLPYHCNLIYI